MGEEAQYVFRPMNILDLDQVCALEQICFADPWSQETIRNELERNELAFYGVIAPVEQIGQVFAYGGFWKILDEGHITNIAVVPEMRGRGLGKMLVKGLMQLAQIRGVERMTLEVRPSNQVARRLYEKMGFEEAGIRKNYYENKEDALIMWCELAEQEKE